MPNPRTSWTSVLCDSLEKVFPDADPRPMDTGITQHVFAGETIAVQVALKPPTQRAGRPPEVDVEVVTGPGITATLSSVDLVPASFLAFDEHDDGYLRDTAGLYPDPLRPMPEPRIRAFIGQWRAVWIDLCADDDVSDGTVPIRITLRSDDGTTVGAHDILVHTVAQPLPPLQIVNTHWFHCDGLATHYDVEVWSDEHWQLIDRFLAAAAELQINSVLTPVWTPPLDTAVGHYRRSTQLVGIAETADGYVFDFARLQRWMAMARAHGIRSLEISHLFTQWGAAYTPAIYVERDGHQVRAFGWDVPATDPSYRKFLDDLLPALLSVLDAEWGLDHVIFHVSDEPHGEHAESYRAARSVVDDLLAGCTIVDALSDFELFSSGTVPIPVVATDHAEPFLRAGVHPLWLYYCVSQHRDVANRFIAMPSSRNRAIGTQLYLTGAAGFLHWGFNFYNSAGSLAPIDPFASADADGSFPAGDPFLVYPGPDRRPWHSIRSRVFGEAMNDLRLLQLVRDRHGDDLARAIADPDGDTTLSSFSLDPDHYRRMRARLADSLR
ncbi:DUF4091 domain-containing protein [Haloactinopolyspora sp.]|uniref:DUF4091 domain-containing protein n=1 Tax=Haloactinopolyspora sp. TaxID=1966353 RepID=UPI0026247EC8|nr:DUF4091 domain-containing protein [Haloactinopolyspora sp.]